LKRHAEKDFWRWLASWSVMVRHPKDLGFDDPATICRRSICTRSPSRRNTSRQRECCSRPRRQPWASGLACGRIPPRERVAAAVEIVAASRTKPWLIWCNLNSEADAIERLLPTSLQVAGRHPVEMKVERLLGFKEGRPPILISVSRRSPGTA
jgi:hypothetical protein